MFSRPFEVWVIYRIKKVPRLRRSHGRPGQADHLRIDSQPCRVCVGTNKTQTFVREPGRTAGRSAPPDFLSGLVVSVNLMRLSSKKAAYVVVDESSVVGNPEFAPNDKQVGEASQPTQAKVRLEWGTQCFCCRCHSSLNLP
jgi:hypothetical protein